MSQEITLFFPEDFYVENMFVKSLSGKIIDTEEAATRANKKLKELVNMGFIEIILNKELHNKDFHDGTR